MLVLSSATFDMSISPRTLATGLPSWSSNFTSASIVLPLQGASQLDGRAGLFATDIDSVHQRLHQLHPSAAVLAARRPPRAVVAHGHEHVVVAADCLEIEAGLAW